MAVITISRDIGSGGLELTKRTAELTDYRIADKGVIERIMREYGFVNFDKSYEASGGFFSAEEELTERTISFLDQIILAIAKTDRVVIVGRGGFAPLAGFTDALHVRVTAPFTVRVDRVMRENGIDERSEAERFVAKRDKARHGFVARYYGSRWDDASPFDLVVNMECIGVEAVAKMLSKTVENIDGKTAETPSVRDIKVDNLLLDVTKKRLSEAFQTMEDL
jgi:cytidylate kinase